LPARQLYPYRYVERALIVDFGGWGNSFEIIPREAAGHPKIAQFTDPSQVSEQDQMDPILHGEKMIAMEIRSNIFSIK